MTSTYEQWKRVGVPKIELVMQCSGKCYADKIASEENTGYMTGIELSGLNMRYNAPQLFFETNLGRVEEAQEATSLLASPAKVAEKQ